MTGMPGYTTAVNEFVQQAQTWLTQASTAAQASAAKVEAGTYTMADANTDMVQAVTLVASGWLGWFAACLDAATELSTSAATLGPFKTADFSTAAPVTADCALALDGPLLSGFGDQLPVANVTFDPPKLLAGSQKFKLVVDPAGVAYGYYTGQATATPLSGTAEKVAIYLTVPPMPGP